MAATWDEYSQYIIKSIESILEWLDDLEHELRDMVLDLERRLVSQISDGDADIKTWAEVRFREIGDELSSIKEQVSAIRVSQVKFEASVRQWVLTELRRSDQEHRDQDVKITEMKGDMKAFLKEHGTVISALTAGLSLAMVVLSQTGVI